jgi:hypothetical protein
MSTIKDQEKYERWNKEALRVLDYGRLGEFWARQTEVEGSPEAVEEWIGIADMLIGKLEEGKERLLDRELEREKERRCKAQADADRAFLEPVSAWLRIYQQRHEFDQLVRIEPCLSDEDFLNPYGIHWTLISLREDPEERASVAVTAGEDCRGKRVVRFLFFYGEPSWSGIPHSRDCEPGEAVAVLMRIIANMMLPKQGTSKHR